MKLLCVLLVIGTKYAYEGCLNYFYENILYDIVQYVDI
jgi:hypothetical protein